MFTNPLVTDEDRQRGWTELEIQFPDGRRECVRVHAPDQKFLVSLATLGPGDALNQALAKVLRQEPEFVAELPPLVQVEIMSLLVALTCEAQEGAALIGSAVELAAAKTILNHG